MTRIKNDKYYTPRQLANYCWDKVEDIIGMENISEIIEPSCGDGAFYDHPLYTPTFGYDIDPECEFPHVIKADYLTQDIQYLEGRLVIGNPPYGKSMNMAQKFFRKSVQIADYIAFIFPIGQLNNKHSLYEFDLVYSEDLGYHTYTDRELHCCFNIYKRPESGKLNKRPTYRFKDLSIYRQDKKDYGDKDFDIRMCYWGNSCAGKILQEGEHYAAEYKIKVHNASKREEVIRVLSTFDWKVYLKDIAARKIQIYDIIEVLRNSGVDIE